MDVLCISRKSAKRPMPWLLSCANADTKRSRSPAVSRLAFLRTRTITGTEPTSVVPVRASIVTSPLLMLGRPNRPATKNDTEAPLIGTARVKLFPNAPVVPERKTTTPPVVVDLPVICTLTVGEVAPDGLVTRIRQGEGAHETNRAPGLTLLLICNSTFMVMASYQRLL